ncbi:MAG: MBL fold metallo-hydrolase [Paracoccaceae bacterium]|nr:MBL fold metallo-hydrolase [Paracoccaceae bacterium]
MKHVAEPNRPDRDGKEQTAGSERPQAGLCQVIAPGLRRVLAPNPSPMTHWGTNTFLIGQGEVAVIDPGPALPLHQAAILAALHPGERISHIFVTHAHLDHSPLAASLSRMTGAPILGFGPALAGRSAVMQRLAGLADVGGGEGVDIAFSPDVLLADRTCITGPGWTLETIHTPGHFAGHLCFAWNDTLFSGDHVMGWASSLVSPPDGDMAAYMASLARLAARKWRLACPAHGAPIGDVAARLAFLAAHRHDREAAILAALDSGPTTLPVLTAMIYADTPPALLPAAARNIFAHLIDLETRNLVFAHPDLTSAALFSRP